ATGLPITQIATSLHISNNTIKTHLKNVYRKMNVESREEAVIRGRELALL
ncbi:MAG: LuxR C-terminal-related transcriptional regulator, partial [Actinomycetes bacterium]